jgi:hypothetical protein
MGTLLTVGLDELTVTDEASFSHVALYSQLKLALRQSGQKFRIPEPGSEVSWDRAVFLNLTFWNDQEGGDVLCDASIPADVVAHIAWHSLASKNLALHGGTSRSGSCAEALFFAEAIASAFDLYLVGRLLRNVPDSDFIVTQVPIMAEAAEEAGVSEGEFVALLESVADDPERAFEDLRTLLFDVTRALADCKDSVAAHAVLERFEAHRFACLLHHFQLSAWILYARAYGVKSPEQQRVVHELDGSLRKAPVALDWLSEHWLGHDGT